MPRLRVDMDQHKDFILERLKAGKPHATVLKDLETERDLKISPSTLKRALTEWKFRANKREKLDDTEELRARVAYFFHELRLTDDETQQRLEEEGFSIGRIRLARLRKDMGLYKKCPPKEQELAEGAIAKALLQEIKNGGIEQMGRTKLYNYLRAKYNVVGRDRIYKIASLFDPDGPRRRKSENGKLSAKRRTANKKALADQATIDAAAALLEEPQMPQMPQMPLPSYPPPPMQMPLHYGI